MTEKNVPALKRLRNTLIEAHGKNALNMIHWASRTKPDVQVVDPDPGECGTALCAAGWGAVNAGWQIDWSPGSYTALTCSKDGSREYIEFVAIEALGLTVRESMALFNAANPEPDEDIELSEVIRTLDGLILLAEKHPDRSDVEDAFDTNESRRILINLADNPSDF